MKKRLRFGLRTLLLVTAFLAVGLFWIRWPMMTASSFVANPSLGKTQVIVDKETLDEQLDRIRLFSSDEQNSKADLVTFDRSVMDVLVGVQRFEYGSYDITARRGKIAIYGPYYYFGPIKARR